MSSDPVIVAVVLSDGVIREWGTGKLSLIGCFNMYQVPALPFAVPPFFITVMLTNFKGKFVKPKIVTVRIEDTTDACVLANISGQMNAASDYDFKGVEIIEMAFPILPFHISHAGTYLIDVLVDREKVGSRNLTVLQPPTTSTLPPTKI